MMSDVHPLSVSRIRSRPVYAEALSSLMPSIDPRWSSPIIWALKDSIKQIKECSFHGTRQFSYLIFRLLFVFFNVFLHL